MPTTILRFSKIGVEDLAVGTGTFDVQLSGGRAATLHKINLSSFVHPVPIDNAIYYTSDDLVGQSANLTYDPDTMQLTVNDSMRVGSVGVASETLHVAVDGAATMRVENTGGTTADASVQFALHGVVDWNITADDSDNDNLIFSSGGAVSATPNLVLRRDSQGIAIGSASPRSDSESGLGVHIASLTGRVVISGYSSSVSHGMTDRAPNDCFVQLGAALPTGGGAGLTGITEDVTALWLRGWHTTEDTTALATSFGSVVIAAATKTGASTTAMGATANILAVLNNTITVFLVKGDGDVYNRGGSTAMVTFDDYDDVQLLQTVKAAMAPNYRETLAEWVDGHTQLLERTGVITRSDQGGGWFISQRGWRGLLIDAITQLDRRLTALEAHTG